MDYSEIIYQKIFSEKENLKKQYHLTKDKIGYFFIDDLLPDNLANLIANSFPDVSMMQLKKSLKEDKYISAQMNKHNDILENVIYAFQDEKIVKIISEICNVRNIYPDENLYAGGISLMKQNQFLKPHLDNSHDKDRKRWRVFNLLYYVSENWELDFGGNLELWSNGLHSKPIEIESKFNRLVIMATHQKSWHSVNEIKTNKQRKCISNYYFADNPLTDLDQFHVTTFRGRPNEKIKNFILKLDSSTRMFIRKLFKKGIIKNNHYYKK